MKRVNRAGEKFGRLTVLKLSNVLNYKGVAKWECVCDCGRVAIVDGGLLQSKQSTSCGCSRFGISIDQAKHLCLPNDFPLFKGRERQVYRDYIKHILRKYGLYESDIRLMMDNQRGCCAICGKSLDHFGKNGNVDHCHKTNVVRGLLCDLCNHGIGSFFDNIENLKNAIKYLEDKNVIIQG